MAGGNARKEGWMGLYGGRTGAQLTISDALTAGYRFLLNPDFAIPIAVIGVVVNVIAYSVFVPVIVGVVASGGINSVAIVGAIIASVIGTVIAAILGGVVLNLYGQVWATMASEGPAPKMAAAFDRLRDRWVAILGAGIIVGAIELLALIALAVVAAVLGALGVLVFLVGIVAMIYVGIRLSLSTWFAADGADPVEAVRESWEITNRQITTVVVWSVVIGVVVGLIGAVAGIVLNFIPLIGPALTSTLGTAFGFGAGVTLYHRIKDA